MFLHKEGCNRSTDLQWTQPSSGVPNFDPEVGFLGAIAISYVGLRDTHFLPTAMKPQ